MCSEARDLFFTDEDALNFAEEYELDIGAVYLLEGMGRFLEAAELHVTEGRTFDAIDLLLRHTQNASCKDKAVGYLLRYLWSHVSYGVTSTQIEKFEELNSFLQRVSSLESSFLSVERSQEVRL